MQRPSCFGLLPQSNGTRSCVDSFKASCLQLRRLEQSGVLSRSPSAANAKPKPVLAAAQSSGARSRVRSFKASFCAGTASCSRAVLFSAPRAPPMQSLSRFGSSPIERCAFASKFFQSFCAPLRRLAAGQCYPPALRAPTTQTPSCFGSPPIERCAFASKFLQSFLMHRYGLLQQGSIILPFPERLQRGAQAGLGPPNRAVPARA